MLYIFLYISFFLFQQTKDNFLYWENIGNEKQNTILQSKEVFKNVRETYYGTFSPSDDVETFILLDSLSIFPYNEEIKALYFYVFNNILITSDGALSEVMGYSCLNILISNSEYVIFYLQDKPKILEIYATVLGYEFYFKEEGTSDLEYNYADFKEIISRKIKRDERLLETFNILSFEIEDVMRKMD